MQGILSYGAHIPRSRLRREDITVSPSLGVSASSRGSRAVAGYDEDTTSMGVEAARQALRGVGNAELDFLFFSTPVPAYLEKTNATAIHAVLDLPARAAAIDLLGSVRSAAATLSFALAQPGKGLAVLSDIRTSLPGGGDERDGGDAAVAFVTGKGGDVVAELLATAAVADEFIDRWRLLGEPAARRWEERFGVEAYMPLGRQALDSALEDATLSMADINHLVVASANGRAASQFARSLKVAPGVVPDDLTGVIGNTGAAHFGILLAGVLDRAEPDAVIAVVVLADGAEVFLFKTTSALAQRRAAVSGALDEIAGPTIEISYTTFLRWRGMLASEPPRRTEPQDVSAPALRRASDWKLRHNGSRCNACGEKHFPAQRICQNCHVVDAMAPVGFAENGGTIVTAVVDRLAASPSPPAIFAAVNLDGGGRIQCELTEVGETDMQPGDRVEPTFRRISTTRGGIHNYFWKMRPTRAQETN